MPDGQATTRNRVIHRGLPRWQPHSQLHLGGTPQPSQRSAKTTWASWTHCQAGKVLIYCCTWAMTRWRSTKKDVQILQAIHPWLCDNRSPTNRADEKEQAQSSKVDISSWKCLLHIKEHTNIINSDEQFRSNQDIQNTNRCLRHRSRGCTQSGPGRLTLAYFSQKLLEREQKYSVIEKECLAVVLGIWAFWSLSTWQAVRAPNRSPSLLASGFSHLKRRIADWLGGV